MTKLLHAVTTGKALRAYYDVYNAHGHDYPEEYYEEMIRLDFEAIGMPYCTQVEYPVIYKGIIVGKHITDMEIDESVVLEFKVQDRLLPRHQAQLISNLKVTGKLVGLLLNFGSVKPEYLRCVFTPEEARKLPVWTPDTRDPHLLYPTLTAILLRSVWEVFRELGAGFVHRIYTNALRVEMSNQGVSFKFFRKLDVHHRNRAIGQVTFHHFIIDEKLALVPVTLATITSSEVNKVRTIMRTHALQLGMIVNFQNEKLDVKYVREQ
jgi:GxxExxY protein